MNDHPRSDYMDILVIDGMGGGIGKSIIEHIKNELADVKIMAVGTNSIASSAMIKAGADHGATGENAVIYNCAKADFIIGAIGIIFANSLHGEISHKMAEAVSSSPAHKILLPIEKCNVTVLGVADKPIQSYISEIAKKIKEKSA
jgi:acyl-coenzyme A synthetase/AMP-(fatty) acid ligase